MRRNVWIATLGLLAGFVGTSTWAHDPAESLPQAPPPPAAAAPVTASSAAGEAATKPGAAAATSAAGAAVSTEAAPSEPVDCDHEGLFGGVLVPLGEEYAHVEITFDPESSIFTLYFLDGEALEPVPLRQNQMFMRITTEHLDADRVVLLAPKEDEAAGETEGHASAFWGGNQKLIGVERFAGSIDQIGVKGRVFTRTEFSYPQ